MDNMETMETITEPAKETMEAVAKSGNGLRYLAGGGIIAAASIAAWEFAVKPLGRRAKRWAAGKRASKKNRKDETVEMDIAEMDIEEIPDID